MMKRKKLFTISSIILVLTLIISILIPASAATVNPGADASADKWIPKAPMSDAKYYFQTAVVNNKIYAMGGHADDKKVVSSVEEYDPASDKWSKKSAMLCGRYDFQVETVNGKIYAMGGTSTDGKATSSMEEYDPATDKWVSKKSMSTERILFRTEVVNGKIYAIGGQSSSVLCTVEMYDPATDTWTAKAPIHHGKTSFQTEVIDGKIYAIGGHNTNSVEEYDPASDTWTEKASMIKPRECFQTVVINGKIYAIGGDNYDYDHSAWDYYSQVEEYDPSLNNWTAKKSMSTPRCYFQAKIYGDKILVFGGCNHTDNCLSSAEMYDSANDTWMAAASLSDARVYSQAETVDGKIYAVGGSGSGGLLNSVEEYYETQSPTLTVTPSADKVKIGSEFTTTVAIHKGTNICAEDIKLTYDTNLFEYAGSEAKTGLKIMKEDSTTTPGAIRFILSCLGKDNAATGDKDLLTLKFKAKKPGQGKVSITKGRIADNATLEMDVAAADCGEATITVESNKDVNRSGDVTLIDLGIDGWYYGSDAKDTDSTKYDADVMPNGKIDNDDLSEITEGILSNSKYPNN